MFKHFKLKYTNCTSEGHFFVTERIREHLRPCLEKITQKKLDDSLLSIIENFIT